LNRKMSRSGIPDLNGSPICLLDDDSSVLKSTGRLLLSAGWSTEPFLDPQSFLSYARTNQPHLLVLDMSMPLMHGLEVQKRLREVSPHTQVIVLTAKDDPALRSRATNLGAARYLIKPVEDEELLSGIEAVLRSEPKAQAG
jgi:FixJ family two-component response regulator